VHHQGACSRYEDRLAPHAQDLARRLAVFCAEQKIDMGEAVRRYLAGSEGVSWA
jgi:hypothetical protein